jgi:hypothetical protein
MVRHDDIGIDGETSRFPSLIQGFAGYDLNLFGSKDGKAVFGYSSNVKSRTVSDSRVRLPERPSLSAHHAAEPKAKNLLSKKGGWNRKGTSRR